MARLDVPPAAQMVTVHGSRHVVMSDTCSVHIHHEWVPIEVHHVWPKGLGGPDTVENKVKICANGHYTVHAYIDLLMKYAGVVPADLKIHFGYQSRNLAQQGWTEAGQPTSGHHTE